MPAHAPSPPSTGAPLLPSLDMGRFVAALLVAVFHMGITVSHFASRSPFDGLYRGGHSGVNYFFVLSGFIIMHVHRTDIGESGRLSLFAKKRIIRIAPLLWITMIGWGLVRILLPGGTGGTLKPSSILFDCLLLPHDGESVIGAVWTLRRELVFYLIFGLVIVNRRTGLAALVAWQAAIVVNVIHPFFFIGPEPDMLLGVQNLGFGAGMILALAAHRRPVPVPRAFIIAGAALFLATMTAEWRYGPSIDPAVISLPLALDSILYLIGSALIVAGMASADLATRRPRGRWSAVLGDSSYALYLTQGPVGSVAIRLLRPLWPLLSPEVLTLALTVICVAAAVAINRWLEKPVARRLRNLLLKRGTRAPIGSSIESNSPSS